MNKTIRYITVSCAAFLAACASNEPRVTEQDTSGNYATTSEYKAAQRQEFTTAIRAGVQDFDRRRQDLENRASKMGQDVVDRLHEHLPGLTERRTKLMNELVRLEAALDPDWPARRNDVQEAYDDLRKALDEAFAEVLG